MKQTGASGLASVFQGDRFHVGDIRAREQHQHQHQHPHRPSHRAGEDFVDEFKQMQLRDNDVMVDEFARFRPREDPLEDAFALYLQRGVVSMRAVQEGAAQMPFPLLMERAVGFVRSAMPALSWREAEGKAVEMLHNLNLDSCQGRPHRHHHQDESWAEEMHAEAWAEEFNQVGARPRQRDHRFQQDWADEMRLEEAYSEPTWAREYEQREFAGLDRAYEAEKWANEFIDQEKKNAVQEEDDGWFEDFLTKEKELQVDSLKQITAKLSAIDDPKLQNSNFMSFVKGFSANNGAHPDDWAQQYRNDIAARGGDWETEYGQNEEELFNSVFGDAEFEGAPSQFGRAGRMDEYALAPNNPYTMEADPYQKGVQFFQDGRFAEAVLALEAAVARNEKHGAAWHLLGKAHQEGDKDWQAIAALQRATSCDPSNLLGLVDQAVSYVNNNQKDRALATLEEWLRNNPRYAHLAPPPLQSHGGDVTRQLRDMYERQDLLIDSFVEAAQTSPQNVDPEVQICLGLLYSLALEYDNAAMCFQAALSKKQDDYALWNKLGATLANGGRSQEALQAYFQALERKPLYVRARANLGISFLAMKLYVDAAKQFLSALSIEPDAIHIWTNLETAFSYMERKDLVALARQRHVDAFRKEFDF